jgi:hypothetical protein
MRKTLIDLEEMDPCFVKSPESGMVCLEKTLDGHRYFAYIEDESLRESSPPYRDRDELPIGQKFTLRRHIVVDDHLPTKGVYVAFDPNNGSIIRDDGLVVACVAPLGLPMPVGNLSPPKINHITYRDYLAVKISDKEAEIRSSLIEPVRIMPTDNPRVIDIETIEGSDKKKYTITLKNSPFRN